MIHQYTNIHPNAKLGENVTVEPFTSIYDNVEIGDGTVIQSHVNIKGNTKIGANNKIYPFVSIGNDPQDLKYKNLIFLEQKDIQLRFSFFLSLKLSKMHFEDCLKSSIFYFQMH